MPVVSIVSSPHFDKRELVEVQSGKILYDELEAHGLILPHGCLAGSCGSCRIEIIEGAENLAPPGAVEMDTIESLKKNYPENKVIRLSCRAKVLGNVTIAPLK
jgi:ferredoxin